MGLHGRGTPTLIGNTLVEPDIAQPERGPAEGCASRVRANEGAPGGQVGLRGRTNEETRQPPQRTT